jgi:hypothetical protein
MNVFAERKRLQLKRQLDEAQAANDQLLEESWSSSDDDDVEAQQATAASNEPASELPLLVRTQMHEPLSANAIQFRERQIEVGKNTPGYRRFVATVPREQRTAAHPRTPPTRKPLSRRQFDGLMRKWRRMLHAYDVAEDEIEIDIFSLADEWAEIERQLAD